MQIDMQIETIPCGDNTHFERYNGHAKVVQLTATSDKPLKTIDAKAFLSCKTIEKLILPDTLENVEDWRFAHMKTLREITLPAKELVFGKKVFLGCDHLEKVFLVHSDTLYEGIPYFLASMFRFFSENSLGDLKIVGGEQGQWTWLAAYDEALQAYIKRPHDYDFEPAFIGWFDIEDVDDQKQHFVAQQRRNKIGLAFRRLIYDARLSEACRQQLGDFLLLEHSLVEEMFLEKEEELGTDIRDYRVWEQVGGLDRDCAGRFLEVISEDEPEIRGYLLKIQLNDVENNDFFDGLDL